MQIRHKKLVKMIINPDIASYAIKKSVFLKNEIKKNFSNQKSYVEVNVKINKQK